MPNYLQHGRRHAVGGSDPIPGLSSGSLVASAYVETLTGTTFTGNVGAIIPFQFFNTTDKTVFGTNPSGSTTLPPNNLSGDKSLMLLQAGAYIVDCTTLWSVAPGNFGADVQTHGMAYNDLGQATTLSDITSTTGSLGSNQMTQAYHLFMVSAPPGLLSIAAQGATAGSYTVSEAAMVVHYFGPTGTDISVY